MSVIHVLTFCHTTHQKWFFSLTCHAKSSWHRIAMQSLPPIAAGEICIKIFCEISHNPETNTQNQNVNTITERDGFCFISRHRIFFAHPFCDSDHLIDIHTPYIYVTRVTQIFAVWTVERFSARFHSIRTGPGYLCRLINNKPRAASLSVNRRRGVLCHPISRSKFKALVVSSATW